MNNQRSELEKYYKFVAECILCKGKYGYDYKNEKSKGICPKCIYSLNDGRLNKSVISNIKSVIDGNTIASKE